MTPNDFDALMIKVLTVIRQIDPADLWGVAFTHFDEERYEACAWGWSQRPVFVTGKTPSEALKNMHTRLLVDRDYFAKLAMLPGGRPR
jgi:hypothetical protein